MSTIEQQHQYEQRQHHQQQQHNPNHQSQPHLQQQEQHMVANSYELKLAASSSQHKMTISDLETKWKDVPDKYFITIAQILAGHINDSEEFDRFNDPMLKSSIKSVVWIFLIQYAALAILGVVMNIGIMVYILYHRLYKDVTQAFICNLALCHFVQCAIVLPITLMVMLIQNWIFGQFLCFFLPMLQDIPLHVAMISHILIAWDRMRWLGDPLKGRLPAFVCCCATWLTGMIIALPYPIYTIYVEIGDYVPRLNGIGLCVVNLMDDMHEYMRGLFLIMYCGPSVLLAYLYIRTSQELREPDGSFSVMMFEHQTDKRNSQRRTSAMSTERPYNGTMTTTTTTTTSGIGSPLTTVTTNSNGHAVPARLASRGTSSQSYDLYSAELDVCREKRKQRNFGTMAATQVVCLCPLMVLRMARLSMEETYDNQKHLDFTYLMFVWIAFLPTIIFPCIYATQILPRVEQERLRGYFRLSTKRLQKSRSKESENSGEAQKSRSRGNSIENKDEFPNTTKTKQQESNGGAADKDKRTGKQQLHQITNDFQNRREHLRNGGGRAKKNDVRIKITADSQSRENGGGCNGRERGKSSSSMASGQQINLTIESFDNNSFSNMTASTYCNGNSSLLDDGGVSNFGDGEDSSIVSGMIVSSSNNSHNNRRPSNFVARQKEGSDSEIDSITRLDSPTTLERDLEIMDLLERRRSMDVPEPLELEQLREATRQNERRRLPDIEKIFNRQPKAKMDSNFFDTSTDTSIAGAVTGSTNTACDTAQMLSTATACASQHDPLTTDEAYSTGTTSNSQMSFTDEAPIITDEEVPQDFFDEYTPGSEGPKMPAISQYQYTRRQSRKSTHFGNPILGSHRSSKRDSFNSLNGSDLIAGAFGELDPTQPLTKMSVIESRMRRSSGRSSSFSNTARSSMRSRDLNSTHTMHPELDFRENIFAEL